MRRAIFLVALAIVFAAGATLSPKTVSAERPPTPTGIATDPILQAPYEAGGKPIAVVVSLHIVNLASIDEVNQQFQLDAYLFEQWTDPRLAYTPAGPQDQVRNYAFGQIWVPQLEMINAATPRSRDEVSITVRPDGMVSYAERLVVRLSSRFELRRFPFDQQQLLVIIHPFLADGPHVTFKLGDTSTWTASEFKSYTSLAQWHLLSLHSQVLVAPTYGGLTVPEARFEIDVERRSSFYVWKVFLPLLLMVFLSWAVFWIEANDLSNQIQVAITTILTVIAFAFAISATMPRLPYLTYIDAFFLECYIYVFLAVVELMTVHVTHRSEVRRDLGLKIRRYSRWVIPVCFVVTNIVIAVHFLG
jgi:Neurotransmitter-gated ion-channel ligand binding domain/Neurotransmitter-gated ion-channel transmembrane region